jgi:adenosine deaminase
VCINSDDPNVMSIDLVNEYRICRDLFGFANEDFAAMNRAALGHSFLPAAVRERVRDEHFPAAAVC